MSDAERLVEVGDGKSDATPVLQRALDAAAAVRGTVHLPPGTYLCSTLRMPSHVGLSGDPTWNFTEFGGAILRLNDPKACCLLDLTGSTGARIHGLSLDGAKVGSGIHGVSMENIDYSGSRLDHPHIERCRISGFTGDGIRLSRCYCLNIRGSMSVYNGGNGLYVRGWDGFVLDNWLSLNGGAGYAAFEESSSMTITGNRVEWNMKGNIVILGGTHYNICGNYLDGSGGPGITLLPRNGEACFCFTISGNVLYRSGGTLQRPADDHNRAHARFEHVHGLVCSGNTFCVGRGDSGTGEWSPAYGIVYGALENSIIKDNAMHKGAVEKLMLDLGGHAGEVIVKDQAGSLFVPRGKEIWDASER